MREALTNEELAILIKSGKREYLPVLWGQCRKIIRLLAIRHKYLIRNHVFVDFDDLTQCGYLALEAAINEYKPDKAFKFITYLTYAYKREIYRMFGNKREGNKHVLPEVTFSLNAMIENDDNETERINLLPDDRFDIIEDYEREETKKILAAAIALMYPQDQLVIYGRYFKGKTQRQLVDGVTLRSIKHVANVEERALTFLRKTPSVRALYYGYYDVALLPSIKTAPDTAAIMLEHWEDWVNAAAKQMERVKSGL